MRGKGHRDDLTDWHGDSQRAKVDARGSEFVSTRDAAMRRENTQTHSRTALLSTAELLGIDASSILAWLGILRRKNKHET